MFWMNNNSYKITNIVRTLWLAERRVCMRVCKHGCGVKMFCFSRANALTWEIVTKKVSIFFRWSWHFKREKSVFWKAFFLQNKNWLRVQDFVDKTLRLVRISLLISAIQRVLRFSSGNLFYKSNRKLFSCVCLFANTENVFYCLINNH